MSDGSDIEWLIRPGTKPATWNPIRARHRKTGKVGWFCIHASIGCIGCYAEGMNLWRGNGVEFKAQMLDEVEIFLDEKILEQPLHWRTPRTVFPMSMSDLYGEWVSDEIIARVTYTMARCQQHTFIVLTKRADRQKQHVDTGAAWARNIWRGTSVEDQKSAYQRLHHLRDTKAVVRHVSFEPILENIDLSPWLDSTREDRAFDWAMIGGHSGGKKAKATDIGHIRSLRDQCRVVGVPCFVKQLGSKPFVTDYLTGHGKTIEADIFLSLESAKGGDMSEWPEDLRVREFPVPHA